MSFAVNVESKAEPIRQAILAHPFITGIGDGTLKVENFKYYVLQDYVYLIDYSRVLALASARAPDLNTQGWFARLLHETLDTEMDLHRSYCAQFDITSQDLEATVAAPTTLAYTRYLLGVAYQGSYQELVAAFLPCQWGYWDIGNHLAHQGEPSHAPLYCQWIQMYVSEEYKALADWARSYADELAESSSAKEVTRMENAYLTSLKYEYMFWDMAYKLEAWPV